MEKQKITYSKAVEEIEAILEKFDSGQMDVDELGKQVKRASDLIKLCKDKLRTAEKDVSDALETE